MPTTRLELVSGMEPLVQAEERDRTRFAELLTARVPETWPPELVSDPEELAGWWTWYVLSLEAPPQEKVLVGVCGLRGWPAVDGSLQIGCSFLPEFRDRGYGTEAVGALTQWALRQQSITRVFAEICLDNKAAHEVLNKVGFVKVGEGSDESLTRFKYE